MDDRLTVVLGGIFFAALLAYGLISRRLDARSVTPQAAILAVGVAAGVVLQGSTGLEGHTGLLRQAGEIALVLCLYVDAARIDIAALRGTAALPVRLLALGLPLTIGAGAIVAALVFPALGPADLILLALLLAPTDAALGALVVNSASVPVRIRQALNVESGLNDGLVTPLVLVAAAFAAAGTAAADPWLADAGRQIIVGAAAGIGIGGGAAWLLREADRRAWVHDGAHWVAAPAIAFLAWFVAHEAGGNAFVAAFVAGLATAAVVGRVSHDFLEFGEIGGELLGLAVFFLVGLLIPSIGPLDAATWVYAILSLTVIRMVPVAASLVGTSLAPPTVLFVGWFGPRGLASVVLALVAVEEVAGSAGGIAPAVFDTVILTIALSVVAHGLTAGPAVRAYARTVSRLPTDAAELGPATEPRARGRTIAGGRPMPGTHGIGDADAPS